MKNIRLVPAGMAAQLILWVVAALSLLQAWPAVARPSASTTASAPSLSASAPKMGRLSSGNAVNVSYLDGSRPVAPDAVTSAGAELFGEKVNLFNGSVSFEHTDISLPGNNALPVAFSRTYSPRPWWGARGALADWDLNTPRIEGTFSALHGFVSSGGPGARCSNFYMPPDAWAGPPGGAVDFAPWEFWQGTHLVVPGHGSQELLKRNAAFTTAPADGNSYPLVTRDLWQIGCLPTLRNAPGQGFFAVSPNGVRYVFDWMAVRGQAPVRKGDAVLQRGDWLIMATRVTDRFGNWVNYTYDTGNPLLLTKIESSDGRVITLGYGVGGLSVAHDGTRTWRYFYAANGDLQRVQLPDGSNWSFDMRPMVYGDNQLIEDYVDCDSPPSPPYGTYVGTMWHPSGAKGEFKTRFEVQGRSGVQRVCISPPGSDWTIGSVYARSSYNQSLFQKTITGPGLPALVWNYNLSNSYNGDWAPCDACPATKINSVIDPAGRETRYHFGIRWRVNEGLLLRTEEGWDGATARRTTDFRYRDAAGQGYPRHFGNSVNFQSDQVSDRNAPQDQRVINQQGAVFKWEAAAGGAGFDALARPKTVTKSSSLGHTRTETTQYRDNWQLWVLGQVASVTEASTGLAIQATDHHPTHALPEAKYSFGFKTESYQYYADGTIYAAINPGGRPTWLGEYHRGQPQYATFIDNTQERQVINNLGQPASRTNAAGTTHGYGFDAMGRISQVDYPTGDAAAYHPTTVSFAQVWFDEWGMPAGHWRQHLVTGNRNVYRIFDAFWRERVKFTWDYTDWNNTVSIVETRYDHEGRKTFVSYPTRHFPGIDQNIPGVRYFYDPLGRVEREVADSEHGPLTTRTDYLPLVFQKRVTNPRGHATTFAFQAFDTPSEEAITDIWAPEGVNVRIDRDVFGKARWITRGGHGPGGTVSATRRYVYDWHQRLCKTIEPESGATVQAYDASNNIAWRASGLNLPDTGNCNHDAVPDARKIVFGYDNRERLRTTTYGDGSQAISRDYTDDGLLRRIGTSGGGRNPITWYYEYNNRRLLASEQYTWGDPNSSWWFKWAIDSHGNLAGLTDPWGWMGYSPNALGQPREVSGYASGVSYHPNGMVAGYTLANGVAHSVSQNTRGLPELWRHAGVSQDRYTYDASGNVTNIFDEQQGQHRSMPLYDGLDRLRQAHGPWGSGEFGYDALDNLVSSQVGGRSLTHRYDANNRLYRLEGSQNLDIGYDANGNIVNRGGQGFNFDIGNRILDASGKAAYVYDGHGRRNLIWYTDGTYAHQAYTQDGKLRVGWKLGEGGKRHVYLGDKLIAERAESGVTTFSHTDALGSPVAKTDSAGTVISRTRYEPYGATVAGSDNPRGIGFTGHVNDPDTGLVYMQQRYYDPIAGRFLSVDPVTTSHTNANHFNRYVYVHNNPYRYVDPDGRQADCTGTRIAGGCPSGGGVAFSHSGSSTQYGGGGGTSSARAPAAVTAAPAAPVAGAAGAGAGAGASQVVGPGLLARALGIVGLVAFSTEAGRDSDKMTLFRAIGTPELASIRVTGMFTPAPNGSEMKQFWTRPNDAQAFTAAMNAMLGTAEYRHIVSVAVSMGTYSLGVPGSDPIGGSLLPYLTYSGPTLAPLNRDALANGIKVLK